jgi:hypothetical protein
MSDLAQFSVLARIVLGYGAAEEFADCKRLKEVLTDMRFKTAAPRTAVMTYEQVVSFIETAHELGFAEMALGQALQFGSDAGIAVDENRAVFMAYWETPIIGSLPTLVNELTPSTIPRMRGTYVQARSGGRSDYTGID